MRSSVGLREWFCVGYELREFELNDYVLMPYSRLYEASIAAGRPCRLAGTRRRASQTFA